MKFFKKIILRHASSGVSFYICVCVSAAATICRPKSKNKKRTSISCTDAQFLSKLYLLTFQMQLAVYFYIPQGVH